MKWMSLLQVAILTVLVSGCSGLEYVDNGDLKNYSSIAPETGAGGKVPKRFGALMIKGDENGEGSHIFVIKREKKRYMAETMVADNRGKKDAKFDRAYFSLGSTPTSGGIGIRLRFEY